MPKYTWVIASVLTVAVLLTALGLSSCQTRTELEQARTELEQARGELGNLRETLAKSQAETGEIKSRLGESQTRIAALEKEKEAAVQTHQNLEQEMRAALESKDVTISQLQGKLTVNILDRVLFDSGEAELKTDGAGVLRKVGAILAQHPNLKVHVIGHTDDVPIKASARRRFPSNWELSTARATAAVRFLTESAGVDPRRLGAVGYGEFRPIAENSTPEGRARNRRIAITILSEEMAGSDTVATVQAPATATNSPALPAALPALPEAAPERVAVSNAGPDSTPPPR